MVRFHGLLTSLETVLNLVTYDLKYQSTDMIPVQHKRLNKLMISMTYLSLCRMPEGTPGYNALVERLSWELREAGITEIHERWTLQETMEQMKLHPLRKDRVREIVNDYKM